MNIETVEYALILIIVLIQFWIFFRTKRQINIFKDSIPDASAVSSAKIYLTRQELNTIPPEQILGNISAIKNVERVLVAGANATVVTIIESSQNHNEVFKKILRSINTYLVRNSGATSDFNLIKDITERNTNSLEEDINLTISIPLFLGLMGTMLGIVIALFSMSFSLTFTGTASEDQLAEGISVLLGGVKIAMIGSLVGLLLTTLNSGLYFKGSKQLVEINKNNFYTFIQTELLPVINQSLGSTFESLQRNLLRFNGEFSENLNKLSGIFNTNFEALSLQESVLSKLENIDIAAVAKYNVNVLKELRSSTQEFEKFNAHFSNLNSSLTQSATLVERLNELLARTGNLQKIADQLDSRLTQSQALLDFLGQHFQNLEAYKKHTTETVSEVGFSIADTFKKLQEHIQDSSNEVKQFTVEELDALKKALSESKTNLGNLQFLENINNDVSQFKDSAASQGEGIKATLQEINATLEKSIATLKSIERSNLALRQKGLTDYLKKRLFKTEDE